MLPVQPDVLPGVDQLVLKAPFQRPPIVTGLRQAADHVHLQVETGQMCARFGGGKGQISLWANMPNHRPGAYYSTSPVVVTQRVAIGGGTVLDNFSTHEQSGVIRAFDIHTGALVWNWDFGNPDATAPIAVGDHYTVNSPNS